ncbi:MAG TPA: hypothetical protein VE990_11000 [Acidimicrobiales bacterium]|nr:hypothetical protein [Acidimicrobiales bacterium]
MKERTPRWARRALTPAVATVLVLAATAGPAAARPKSGGTSTPTGEDVSYPQCGSGLPTGRAFGIVGVNDGLANNLNPCLGPSTAYPSYRQSELYWALSATTGATSQPRASLYVNTADPGNVYNGTAIADWPTTSVSSDPYGTCSTTTVSTTSGPAVVGQDSPACAWQYGYDRATQDARWLTSAAAGVAAQESAVAVPSDPGAYPWWLDVETANSWQSGSAGQAMNVADLQGMVAALRAASSTASARVGIYTTSSQWSVVTGTPGASQAGSLWGSPDWVPGAVNLSGAEQNCSSGSYTGGAVTVTQWTAQSTDSDYACG